MKSSSQSTSSSIADQILVYGKEQSKYLEKFLTRHDMNSFLKISDQQIQMEFKVLSSADFLDEEKNLYTKPTDHNRYIDIHAYNHSRVRCQSSQNYYLNACVMKSIVDGRQFAIFSQAPTPAAVQSFWEAIYEKDVKTIVMLCSFHDPRRGRQSEQYWPNQGERANYKKIGISVEIKQQQKITEEFTITHFALQGSKGQKIVKHIHWTGWSDLKKPLGQGSEKLFRNLVTECIEMAQKEQMFMIHCSAGIGRTGTLGTVIEAIRFFKKNKKLSIFEIVENLRKYRMYCVQTFEQYKFLYAELRILLKNLE